MTDLSDDEQQIERLLTELAPRDSRLSRDRTMFRAGQATGSSRTGARRAGRWMWPAVTACSTAAGLLAGVLITGSAQRVAPVVRHSDDASNRPPAITPKNSEAARAIAAADAPGLFELRWAMAGRVADEFTLAQSDWPPRENRPAANSGPVGGARAPLTYGAALGRLREDETHL